MSTDGPTPWNEEVVCAACGTGLLPLTYALPEDDDPREGMHPHLKCRRLRPGLPMERS